MIALAGHILVDVLARPLDQWPDKGTLTKVERIDLRLGGCVPNTGAVVARLGVPVAVVGRVGADDMGTLIENRVREWATWQCLIKDPSRSTSATVVIVHSDGERSFLHSPGANARLTAADIPMAELVSRGARSFHIGYVLLLEMLDGQPIKGLLDSARAAGLLVSIDVASAQGLNWESLHDLLPSVDVFCPNLGEAVAITGARDPLAAAKRLKALGVRRAVVVKLGAKGCVLVDEDNRSVYIPGHHLRVVNATGAGDAFIGGFLSAWHKGLDWESAARIGNAVAANVASVGSATGAPDWDHAVSGAALNAGIGP